MFIDNEPSLQQKVRIQFVVFCSKIYYNLKGILSKHASLLDHGTFYFIGIRKDIIGILIVCRIRQFIVLTLTHMCTSTSSDTLTSPSPLERLLTKQRSEGTIPLFCCCQRQNIQDLETPLSNHLRPVKISIKGLRRRGSESRLLSNSRSKSKSKKTTTTNKISIKGLRKPPQNATKILQKDTSLLRQSNTQEKQSKTSILAHDSDEEPNRTVKNFEAENIIVGKCIIETDHQEADLKEQAKVRSNIEEQFNNIFGESETKGIQMPGGLDGLGLFEKRKKKGGAKVDISPMGNFSFGQRQVHLLKQSFLKFHPWLEGQSETIPQQLE